MGKFISYSGSDIIFDECPACDFNNHLFSLDCGMAYEDEMFTLAQDWELPIPGFLVASPKRHVEKFSELSSEERAKIFEVVDKCINILRENKVCENFNVIFEEKDGIHFHIWIMPRHDWMIREFGNPTKRIDDVFKYAKNNLRTNENLEYINKVNDIVRNAMKSLNNDIKVLKK